MKNNIVDEEEKEVPVTITTEDIVIFVSYIIPFTISKEDGKYTFSESRV